ncbi:MAG: alpha/beta hydrolase [Cyclobacteriaceae bacterium]
MKYFVLFLITIFMNDSAIGQQTIPLYANEIPNSKPSANTEKSEMQSNGMQIISNISVPTLTVFLPNKIASAKAAVIIFPGGGYHVNAMKHEGTDVARELNKWGIAAFVLKYRTPDDKTMINKEIGPLQDAQQAIRIVRENAVKWDLDSNKIGVMGFSAGGHLAATTATQFDKPVIADVQNINLRPDFLVLGYPVISFNDSIGHMGSRDNLLGKSPSREKIRAYSNELQVTAETPPSFIIHASDDGGVLPANSIAFYESLLKHHVPSELHIYERGGHGFGMNNPTTEEKWMVSLRNWLKSKAFID